MTRAKKIKWTRRTKSQCKRLKNGREIWFYTAFKKDEENNHYFIFSEYEPDTGNEVFGHTCTQSFINVKRYFNFTDPAVWIDGTHRGNCNYDHYLHGSGKLSDEGKAYIYPKILQFVKKHLAKITD